MDNSDFLNILSGSLEAATFLPDEDWQPEESAPVPVPSKHRRALISQGPTNQWDPRLILDLALGIDSLEDILPRYLLTMEEFNVLSNVPSFRKELAQTIRDTKENGLTFTRKAKFQAESYLEVLDEIVFNDATPASVRLEAIRSTVLWAGLVPKEEKAESGSGQTVNVQINF